MASSSPTPPRVTIYDVARAADVAPSTVSRAFSRPGRVSAATHRKVLEAARRLGYRTSAPEQQVRTDRHRRLGIEIPDITNPYFAELIDGMRDAAQQHDYLLILLDSTEDEHRERDSLLRSVDIVDGVILAGTRLSDAHLAHIAKHLPALVLNRRVAGLDSLTPDFALGMTQAMRHLAATGAQQVTYLAGPQNSWSNGERWRAARAAAHDLGLMVQRHGPFPPTEAGGEEAFASLRHQPPAAVICYNDLMAHGFLVSALRAGIHVPEDLQVIGHDDIPVSRFLGPGLTTVASPKRQQGATAVERLIRRIEHSSQHRRPVDGSMPVKLILRGSTRPAAATA